MASKVTYDDELMFPSDYLSAVEFKGKDVTLTIKAVFTDKVKDTNGREKTKWVVSFEETPKKMILNKLSHPDGFKVVLGGKAELWPGQRITLYPTQVPFRSGMTDAIRVRETKPPPKVTPPDADELAAADAG